MGRVMEADIAHPGPGGMYAPVLPCVLSQRPSAKLRRLDLSGNSISFIHNDALRLLPALQDLILSENQLAALPVLPSGIEFLDVRLNRLQSSGIQPEAFVVSQSTMQSVPCPCTLTSPAVRVQLLSRAKNQFPLFLLFPCMAY